MKYSIIILMILSLPTLANMKSISTCLDYSPFIIDKIGKKKWNGPNIETLHHLTIQMSLELDTTIKAPFARCIELLKKGEIDVIAGLIYTKERNSYLHMLPYSHRDQLAIFYLKNNKKGFDPKNILPQQVIGMHRAFALPDNIKQSSLYRYLVPIRTVDNGLEMVLKGRLDGVLATISTGQAIIQEWPKMNNKFAYTSLEMGTDKKIYLGISRKSALSKQLTEIKKAIKLLSNKKNLAHLHINY